ncbi:MAG: radical SAM protein [Alphaproteobacteria bacterium]|nr:radical SAM protein [Alphaproteobacteria bacterium]
MDKFKSAYFKSNNLDSIRWVMADNLKYWPVSKQLTEHQRLFMKSKWFMPYLKFMFKLTGKPSIPILDIPITTRCTLKCRNCSHNMPYYKSHAPNLTFEQFKKDIDKLLASCDIIYNLSFIGGETLLNKDLPSMIDYCERRKQIFHITFSTNTTITPPHELLDTLKKSKKTITRISDYSCNSELGGKIDVAGWKKTLDENHIPYFISEAEAWHCMPEIRRDDARPRHRVEEEFRKCYCFRKIQNLYNGRLLPCPNAKYFANIHPDYKFAELENIDIHAKSKKDLTKALIEFYSLPYYRVCSFCHSGIDTWSNNLPIAEQIKD